MIPESHVPPAAPIRLWWAWADGVVHYDHQPRVFGTHYTAMKHLTPKSPGRWGQTSGIQALVDGEWADVVPDKDYEALADYELRRQ